MCEAARSSEELPAILLYFHRNAILSGNFERLRRGDKVYYVEDVGDTGPVASNVRAILETNRSARQPSCRWIEGGL
jgi:hypothetical protein